MTPVSVPALPPPTKAALAGSPGMAPSPPPGRAPALLHTDFRSLLRAQAGREAVAAGSPRTATPASQARAPSRGANHAAGASTTREHLLGGAGTASDDDPMDSFSRHHASLAPPDALFTQATPVAVHALERPFAPPAAEGAVERTSARSLEHLLPALVKRVAWSGDGRRGTMRLELGAGELAGGTLLVHADGGRVRVHLEVPAGVDASRWEKRIRERLEERRIPADAVEVG
jgi:hypothetical protein